MRGPQLAVLGTCLDPRPALQTVQAPYEGAVNIPAQELTGRIHELPPKDELIRIAGFDKAARRAQAILEKGGRQAELIDSPISKSQQTYRLWKPNEFLEALLPNLKPGTALDLGCGSGRESVFLACNGFQVTACDRLPDALEKGRDLAARYTIGAPPDIEWILRDLENDGPPEGKFDLIVSFRYLHRPLFKTVKNFLNPGGSLVLETFTALHRERHGKPSRDDHVLQLGEIGNVAPGLAVRHAEEAWRGDIHTARLWAMHGR